MSNPSNLFLVIASVLLGWYLLLWTIERHAFRAQRRRQAAVAARVQRAEARQRQLTDNAILAMVNEVRRQTAADTGAMFDRQDLSRSFTLRLRS